MVCARSGMAQGATQAVGVTLFLPLKTVIPHLGDFFRYCLVLGGYTPTIPDFPLYFSEEAMADDQAVSQLLGTLYAAPTSPERWVDFLRDTCEVIGARNAALIEHDAASQTHHVFGSLGEHFSERGSVRERYWEFDEWPRRDPPKLGAVRALVGAEVWPKDGQQWL
jgi:hypothetical protein